MRISDWSSDVCSSDLSRHLVVLVLALLLPGCATTDTAQTSVAPVAASATPSSAPATPVDDAAQAGASPHQHAAPPQPPALPSPVVVPLDRKSVVLGKRGSVRVDLGGRRILKKK